MTGFGLLGHLHKLARASGVTAVVDSAAVPFLDGARAALRDGYVPRRAPAATSTGCARTPTSARSTRTTALLLADAQTSGGLLLAGEIPGAPVIGELVPRMDDQTIVVA